MGKNMAWQQQKKKKKSNFLTSPKQGHFFKDLPSWNESLKKTLKTSYYRKYFWKIKLQLAALLHKSKKKMILAFYNFSQKYLA